MPREPLKNVLARILDSSMINNVFTDGTETHFEIMGNVKDGNWIGCDCVEGGHGLTRSELEGLLGPSHPFNPKWKPKKSL